MMDKTMTFYKEHLWLIILVLSCILFIVAGVDHFVPALSETASLREKIRTTRNQISRGASCQEPLTSLKEQKESLKQEVDQFIFHQNQDAHLSRILRQLSRGAKEKGVSILSILPGDAESKGRYVEIPIRLALSGKYHNLGRFLNRIETGAPAMKIRELKIETQSMVSRELNAEILLAAFYLRRST